MSLPPITYLNSPYKNIRDARFGLKAFVNHRIVGSLLSARVAFGVADGTSRSASSHFGIGRINGAVAIDQYVPLDWMAWTNGDVSSPTWPLYQDGVNPNLTTVTIEHEDGSTAHGGVVDEDIWQVSMELQALLASGNTLAIRAAGVIGATDAMVAQMAAIAKDETGFIDHHQIAGPNKPYCFRQWLDDPGFVYGSPSRRDRLLAVVRGGGVDVPMPLKLHAVEWHTTPDAPFWTGGPGTGEQKQFVGTQLVDSIGRSLDTLWVLVRVGREFIWMKRANLIPTVAGGDPAYDAAVFKVMEEGASVLGSTTVTGATPAQVAAAVAAGQKTAATAVKTGATTGAATAAAKYGG
jgi:hypothetical protein